MPKFWTTGNFFQTNRFSDLTTPIWSYTFSLGQGKVSSNSVVWGARFSRLKGAIRIFILFHQFFQFPCHPYYSSRQKGFPSHLPCRCAIKNYSSSTATISVSTSHMEIMQNSHIRCHDRNLGCKRKFAQGMQSTQRHHLWIAFDLRNCKIVARSKLSTFVTARMTRKAFP